MRIQHNILAMNAYRNYNTNTSALAKNLEKLSSGYKINRAGDDAAGLAISEKMRAQITGLNAAQKNVKDGISLVKTAEGAMQEIQDMLNRMDYLATQSANGTYDDETDRAALQKEVNQLLSEINRIADSANFNGIQLLNGTLDGSGSALTAAQAALAAAQAKYDAADAALTAANNYQPAGADEAMSKDDITGLLVGGDKTSTSSASVGECTILEVDGEDAGQQGFTISFDGVKYVSTGSGAATETFTLTIGAAAITIGESDIKSYLEGAGQDYRAGTEVDGETLAAIIADKFKGQDVEINAAGSTGETYTISASGSDLIFKAKDSLELPNRHYDASIGVSINSANEDAAATGSVFTSGALTITVGSGSTTGASYSLSVDFSFIDENGAVSTATVSVTVSPTTAGSNTAQEIRDALMKELEKNELISKYFDVEFTAGASLNFVLTAKNGGYIDTSATTGAHAGAAVVTGLTLSIADAESGDAVTSPTFAASTMVVDGTDAFKGGIGNSYVSFTGNIVTADEAKDDILASTQINLSELLETAETAEGFLIKIGDQSYRITTDKNSEYYTDMDADGMYKGAKVIYLDKDPDDIDAADLVSALTRAGVDNTKFTITQGTSDGYLMIKQKEATRTSATSGMHIHDLDSFLKQIEISTVTTAADDSIKQDKINAATLEKQAAEAKLQEAKDRVTELQNSPGKSLQLQIGDTSDDYNQMMVNISDMHAVALGVGDLNIGTAEDAADAISVIKAAINQVSGVRGDLGAYQNRLEHTANNLSVMAENIQDAESTIRDTDIAEEMMAYTKNNILIQSAQAMLAQANAVPQGVLQLLG